MINELIQIVQSDHFKDSWSHEERLEFKHTFFQWLFQNWSGVLGQPIYMNKSSILFISLFEAMTLAKKPTNKSEDFGGAFAEFIDKFLAASQYKVFFQYISAVES